MGGGCDHHVALVRYSDTKHFFIGFKDIRLISRTEDSCIPRSFDPLSQAQNLGTRPHGEGGRERDAV